MKLPILMYHYVRPVKKRLSARHNFLDLTLFNQQLEQIDAKYVFVVSNDVANAEQNAITEKNYVWLTFDDGYRDCIDYVLPTLLQIGAKATFYVPTEAIFERKLLDVNKIHILLSSSVTPKQIVKICEEIYGELLIRDAIGVSFSDLFSKYGVANLWNDSETEFIKKLFQKVLPVGIRKNLLSRVFKSLIERSESSWVDEFYLSPDDVRILVENGMEVGSHGHSHEWLGGLSSDQQKLDISKSFSILEKELIAQQIKTMCYPFGSYNTATLRILSELGVRTAVVNRGNKQATFEVATETCLELDRIDIMFFDKFINGDFD